jgi:hypothetical protein
VVRGFGVRARQTAVMAFGQASGPPATRRQVERLLGLLHDAGHRDFRDARGPMGFTQRQASGKFTRDEADELIERLENDGHTPVERSRDEIALSGFSDHQLAAELQRRGWIVAEP